MTPGDADSGTRTRRAIDIREGDELDEAAFKVLIRAAAAAAERRPLNAVTRTAQVRRRLA